MFAGEAMDVEASSGVVVPVQELAPAVEVQGTEQVSTAALRCAPRSPVAGQGAGEGGGGAAVVGELT